MDPRRAMVNAGCTARVNTSMERSGIRKAGRPVGTSPITGVLVNHRTPNSVPAISAARVGGRNFLS